MAGEDASAGAGLTFGHDLALKVRPGPEPSDAAFELRGANYPER